MAARVTRGKIRVRGAGSAWLAPVVALACLLLVCACAPGGGLSVASFPAGSIGPSGTAGAAAAQTRIERVRVRGEHNLVLRDAEVPCRPPEGVTFTTAPRAVYQVILPDAPGQGFIMVYEFPDATAAAEAAADQAAYLATGPARVQTPFGTRHVMRLVGSTWMPGWRSSVAPSGTHE